VTSDTIDNLQNITVFQIFSHFFFILLRNSEEMSIIKRAFSDAAKSASATVSKNAFKIKVPYPKGYLQANSKELLFLNNAEIAEEVVRQTKHSFLNTSNPKWVFDTSPGDCVLARKLLESGARKVRLFECSKERVDGLNQLMEEFPDQVELVDKQIMGKIC